MAISPVNSNTNLLAQYSAANKPAATQRVAQTNSNDIIAKQNRLIQLQQEEINNLKQNNRPAPPPSSGIGNILLATLGIYALFEIGSRLFTRRPPQPNMQELGQMYEEFQRYLAKMYNAMADDVGDLPKPKPKPKTIREALFDRAGKVIGRIIKDGETETILKRIEFYQGTEIPMTIEKFDYTNNKRFYIWNRPNGTKMWEEIFELNGNGKFGTIFYEEDGATIAKVKKGNLS